MAGKTKKNSQIMDIMYRLAKNKTAMFGLIIVAIEIVLAILAKWIVPYDWNAIDVLNAKAAPSLSHLFGTDELGRDIFSRIIYGARYSLSIGIFATLLTTVIGTIIGAIVGYYGGTLDNIVMRILDIIQAMPPILFNIVIATALGSGFMNTLVALAVGGIPGAARLVRGSVMSIRKMEYLESADSINCSKIRTIFVHVLPNAISPSIVACTMNVANLILTAASLSFIGLGVQAPTPEWGAMLSASRNYIRDCPYMVLFPGLAIAITVLALNLLGDGLRDAMDPKLKD
ncbi:MAG: ABC transporter permease [Eubacteriales bacterium]|nr:ABC transporter permease [Eubacteriales bacterium]